MIYDDKKSIDSYTQLMNEFSTLWHDKGFINIFKKNLNEILITKELTVKS